MIHGTDVHAGMLLLIDGKIFKVISASLRGSAKAQKIMHLGLKSIPEGHFIEKAYNPGEKAEQIIPDRNDMQYLYKDEADYYFMNTATYEQLAVPAQVVGSVGRYFKENARIQVEFYNGSPINIIFPRTVQMKVVSCPPGMHEGTDTTFKEATLENGIKALVPQFIKEGDMVDVDTENGKYMDRVKK